MVFTHIFNIINNSIVYLLLYHSILSYTPLRHSSIYNNIYPRALPSSLCRNIESLLLATACSVYYIHPSYTSRYSRLYLSTPRRINSNASPRKTTCCYNLLSHSSYHPTTCSYMAPYISYSSLSLRYRSHLQVAYITHTYDSNLLINNIYDGSYYILYIDFYPLSPSVQLYFH